MKLIQQCNSNNDVIFLTKANIYYAKEYIIINDNKEYKTNNII